MAKVIKKGNELDGQYKHYHNLTILGFLVCGVCFVLFALLGIGARNFGLAPILMLGFGGGGLFGGIMSQKASALRSGLEGEESTAQIVSGLPESYFGFQNIKVTYEGKTSELDMVVVGPTGVFIIETKNLNGTVVGHYENQYWTQKKVGQQGTPYSKNFYNPTKQVGTHTYRLAHFLRDRGINVYINNMVYFSNPETVVQIMGSSNIPVFSALAHGHSAIANHIAKGPNQIPKETVIAIAKLLNTL